MKREHWLGLLLAAIAFALFSPALSAGFVEWDDDINIYRNPHIRGLSGDHLAWMFSDLAQAMRYKPLSWLTWATVASMGGMAPRGFHLVNLLFHSANTALLFFLILRLLRLASPAAEAREPEARCLFGALVAATFWAVHPLRAEPVAWATGLPYGQSVLFALISALCYLRAWPNGVTGPIQHRWLGVSIVAFTLALLTYPIVLTYLLALLTLDWWRWQRSADRRWSFRDPAARAVCLTKLPFAIITAIFLGLALYARWQAQGLWTRPEGIAEFSLAARVMQAFYVWAYSLWKWLLPFDLSPVYTNLVWFKPSDAPFLLSALFVIGMTGVLVWRWRSWAGALALWLAYLSLLLPVLGLTEYPHMPSDRYTIFAHVVVTIALGAGLARLWGVPALQRRTLGISVGVIVAFAALCFHQMLVWRDTESLFRHVLARLPDNRYRCDIYWRYGSWLMRAERFDEAEQCQAAALRIAPDYALPYASLGELRTRQGQWQDAIAFQERALELKPGLGTALNSLAWLRATVPDATLRNGEEALRISERLVQGSAQPDPFFLRTHAAALAEAGEFDRARDAAESGRRLAVSVGETELAGVLDKMLIAFQSNRPFRLESVQREGGRSEPRP